MPSTRHVAGHAGTAHEVPSRHGVETAGVNDSCAGTHVQTHIPAVFAA